MLIYLIKVSVSLAVVVLFYGLLLRKLTFYTWNRWYLLGYSALCFVLPFFNIYDFMDPAAPDAALLSALPTLGVTAVPQNEFAAVSSGLEWGRILSTLVVGGALISLVRFLVRMVSLRSLRNRSKLLIDGGVKVYSLDSEPGHFSFGNSIFINAGDHSDSDLERILQHELAHVQQKHTVDLVWAELLCVVLWFNPFVWMLRRAIRQNLEFLADDAVLKQGVEVKAYQMLLVKVVAGMPNQMVTPFGFSFLKKRIAMMNKNKTARIQLVRFLFMLPCVAALLLAFRQAPDKTVWESRVIVPERLVPESVLREDTVPKKTLSPTPPGKTEKTPVPPKPSVSNTPPVPPVPPVPPTPHSVKAAVRAVPDTAKPFKNITVRGAQSGEHPPLIVVDGVPQPPTTDLNTIDPTGILSITVLKEEGALAKYGKDGKYGVVLVETVNAKPAKTDSSVLKMRPGKDGKSPDALVVFNGKEMSMAEFEHLKVEPASIKSVDVLKGENATKIYGSKGAGGVIRITSK